MLDCSKLFNAAKIIRNSHPELSEELVKTAQNIQNSDLGTTNPESMFAETPEPEQPDLGLNPNIKPFAQPGQSSEQRELHKLTLQLDVPVGTDELAIMNDLLPILKQLEGNDYKLKGYAFDERTRG